ESPNNLHSEKMAELIAEDVKKHLKGVKIKILGKEELKKEKMNLLLSVNAGSGYEPRLVHLTYTPSKNSRNSKHYALVGKGITFDTGGYSLKSGEAMVGMKHDMAGAATVYGAFRSAILNGSQHKLTCILAITDNAVSSYATTPDSIIKGRNGKTVEILNTDAEGRLILADALDYACDQKPDAIIDAATLTGACLVALGTQVCAVLGNNTKLINSLLESAKTQNEYMWQLPIIEEYRKEIRSQIADINNTGKNRFAGTAKGAVFLQEFIKDDIAWAHLDIAGVADSQGYLPYCPPHGASGLIIRSLYHFIMHA
nr:leucyl aminopeptidase family protein [Bacteriovoracaceae bacterium]